MAWEEATEGERGFERSLRVTGGWSCRNGMGRGYGRSEVGVTGAGAAEMAWEEATEGGRGLSGRWE